MGIDFLKKTRRVVVKIGTSSITHPNGKINLSRMDDLSRQLSELRNGGCEPLLVSSGAVGAGMGKLGCNPPSSKSEKRALAAVGQGYLMQLYEKFFAEYSYSVAQVLLTHDCLADPSRRLHSRNTLCTLLDLGVIPIINENDAVAADEIQFGCNDSLSAVLACCCDADLLVILSDIDGLYDRDPREYEGARLIPEISRITAEMEENSRSKGSAISSGGMSAKLEAAKTVTGSGIPMVIANSSKKDVLLRTMGGENVGTLFLPRRHTHCVSETGGGDVAGAADGRQSAGAA